MNLNQKNLFKNYFDIMVETEFHNILNEKFNFFNWSSSGSFFSYGSNSTLILLSILSFDFSEPLDIFSNSESSS